MQQINMFEILEHINNPVKHTIKNVGFDKDMSKYIFKNRKKQFSCKYCGYNPRNWIEPSFKKVKYFLLVDNNWKVEQTFCENCVKSDVGADFHKKLCSNKKKDSKKLSLISWNKYTKKTLKLLWLKNKINRESDMTWYKPYFIESALSYNDEKEMIVSINNEKNKT